MKGFSIINYSGGTDIKKPVTAFIWVYTSASATGLKYLGAQPKEAALL